ncbi:helix-turn-helix domain-containing protein [Nakamurella sp. GG22]
MSHTTTQAPRGLRAVHQQFGFACALSAVPAMATAHRHDDVEVLLSIGGAVVLEHGGRRRQVPDRSVAVFWAGIPHRLTDTEPAATVRWLTVPLVDALAWSLPDVFAADLLRGMVFAGPAPDSSADRMATWADEIGTDRVLTEAARLEARALLLRLSRFHGASAVAGDVSLPQGTDRHAAAIAAHISTHFREPLQLADIARAVHLHPSRAGALFRRHTGVSIGHYLAQCRVAEAQRLLISGDATTSDIATRAGFGSTSSFYATFRSHCHLAPDAYRRAFTGRDVRVT